MGCREANHAADAGRSGVPGTNPGTPDALSGRLREGDLAAFDAFIREQWPRLVYYLVERVRVRELAQDLAQEALARVWERRASLDPSSSVVPYLYQIARNLAIDELRKVDVRRKWREQERQEAEAVEGVTPLQRLEDQEALQAMQNALAALPQRRREAFMLVHIQHLSYREAALVMGNAPQTVANQVATALAELRRALDPFIREMT